MYNVLCLYSIQYSLCYVEACMCKYNNKHCTIRYKLFIDISIFGNFC